MVISSLRERKRCSFDIETMGLEINDDIIGIGFGLDVGMAAYIPFLVPKFMGYGMEEYWTDKDITKGEVISEIKAVLEDPEIKKSGHSSKFDMRQLRKKFEIHVQGLFWDTLCGAYLINENGSHKLDALKNRFVDLLGYSDDWNKATAAGARSHDAPLEVAAKYCCGDCDATYRLTKEQMSIFNDQPNLMWFMDNFYIPMMYFIADFEYNGVLFDAENAVIHAKQYEKEAKELEHKIHEMVGLKFNVDSNDEVAKVLYTLLKFKPLAYTKGGKDGRSKKPSTDAKVLEKYAEKPPVPKLIVDYRHANKMRSTFIERPLRAKDANSRFHLTLHPTGTVTGRLSSDLQNVPKESMIKNLFIAPSGSKLVQADLSQAEVRCFAHYANEKTLQEAFENESIDIHSKVASLIAKIDYDDFVRMKDADDPKASDLRRKAKTVVFGLIYGMGVKSLAEQNNMTVEEAQAFMDKFFQTFPEGLKWIEATHKQVEVCGYVFNLFGRVRRIPMIYSSAEEVRARAKRQAVNSIIQATAADITNLAMIRMYRFLQQAQWPAKIVLTVHDSIVIETLDEYVEQVQRIKHGVRN